MQDGKLLIQVSGTGLNHIEDKQASGRETEATGFYFNLEINLLTGAARDLGPRRLSNYYGPGFDTVHGREIAISEEDFVLPQLCKNKENSLSEETAIDSSHREIKYTGDETKILIEDQPGKKVFLNK